MAGKSATATAAAARANGTAVYNSGTGHVDTVGSGSSGGTGSSSPAVSAPTYIITNKNTGKTSSLTADQLKSMQGSQGLADFANGIKNGTITVSSGGKQLNPFSGSTVDTKGTSSKNGSLGLDNSASPGVVSPKPQLGAKYDAASPANNTVADAAAKMDAMQKAAPVSHVSPNGNAYSIQNTPDGKVSFVSKVTGKPVVMNSLAEAQAYIDKNNPSTTDQTGLANQMNQASENAANINQDFTNNQEASQAEQEGNIQNFQDTATQDQATLAALAVQRKDNIDQAQATMADNNRKALESNERLIRLQSNEHLDTIMQQYRTKGMTEEEARAQAQSDIESQLQKERETVLTAEKDNATLQNQVAQWSAGAQDVISQAQEANTKLNTTNAQTVMNAQNSAEQAAQSAENQSYANTIQSVNLNNYNNLTDIEKQKVLNTLGINQASGNSQYAAQQFISTMGSFAAKKGTRFAQMLRDILSGKKTLEEAQAGLFGTETTTAAKKPAATKAFSTATANFNF